MVLLSRRFQLLSNYHRPGPRSLVTTNGVSVDFLSSSYLDISVHQVCLTYLCIQYVITTEVAGFPHSEIPGSKPIRSSPGLIATYYVLLRLLMPRHPPNALLILKKTDSLNQMLYAELNLHIYFLQQKLNCKFLLYIYYYSLCIKNTPYSPLGKQEQQNIVQLLLLSTSKIVKSEFYYPSSFRNFITPRHSGILLPLVIPEFSSPSSFRNFALAKYPESKQLGSISS